ncbi:MAG: exodeoxyribonuclease VII small subunit [Lachnospiraceae bacterium]|jgi:exodeoxyribonuclease VII small subunit|nr:exodeoxyribonuclease VII small subunit [Lachnospiraceae bacterium]MBP5601002.1 exodeoxyribonuclease VII small subunit [Lachnospiraceae bacterium]
MADKENKEKSLEENFELLDKTISELEKEDVTLEEAFSLYESGMKLVSLCEKEIDTVEKKVLKISGGSLDEFQ